MTLECEFCQCMAAPDLCYDVIFAAGFRQTVVIGQGQSPEIGVLIHKLPRFKQLLRRADISSPNRSDSFLYS